MTPFPWDFLLWGGNNEPLVGVTLRSVNRSHSLLVKDGSVVGHVFIKAPTGARGQEVTDAGPSEEIVGPILLLPTARFTLNFIAGDKTGRYVAKIALNNGNSVQKFVDVK